MARMTQAQLAEKIDLSTTHLGYIEQGRSGTGFETIGKICIALNITIRELFDFDFPV
jgi:DNA-binding XRE family transcriptional regulator